MHCTKHARDETVDTPAFLHERHESGYTALIASGLTEVGKDHPLERVNLVLEPHKIRYGLVTDHIKSVQLTEDLRYERTPRSDRRCPSV